MDRRETKALTVCMGVKTNNRGTHHSMPKSQGRARPQLTLYVCPNQCVLLKSAYTWTTAVHAAPRRAPMGNRMLGATVAHVRMKSGGGMHGAAPSRAQVVSTLGNPSKRRAPQCKLSQYGPCNSECHRGRVARSTGVGHCTQQIPASSVPKEQRPRPAAPLNEVVVCVTASAPPPRG